MLTRVLEPEELDHLEPDDPRARRARRDLRRINRIMGATGILRRALEPALPARSASDPPLRLVEIGCGDGRLMLDVARRTRERWPRVEITLLDRQALVDAATIADYASAGWIARPLTIDVLAWAGAGDPGATLVPAGESAQRFDAVVANLFLHHFDEPALARLLAGCVGRAAAVIACEPRRSRFALAASHLVGAIGSGPVTRLDAVLSVRAGFRGRELSSAWSATAGWHVDEYDDGLFTHVFRARRR
ncbi:methyltransferase domain-containing protein [Piscinibacter koreensis]|uniref:Methyltransferase domain-containing protein n=1 Tax=Piscinibacter koreensis TaxID=2742824 RepID=A0A7Y6TY64_9BURK|nr:methyltransferase domain-containing protein [Schlegelella koreensis]NUZ07805.1 hypothetical protein [Schlegelella koreensis]